MSADRPKPDTTPTAWHRAAKSSTVGSRLSRIVVQGTPILVGRLIGGNVVAVTPVCPHHDRPMDGGAVYTDMIACPHHQYTYDARTGANRYPKNVFPQARKAQVEDIGTYPARDDGEWVWIRL